MAASTTTDNNSQTFQLQSDAAGNWNMVVDQKVAPGPHIVTVQDDQGNETQVMMYILDNGQVTAQLPGMTATSAEPTVIDRLTNVTPPFLFYALGIMAIMIIVLIINALRLSKKTGAAPGNKNKGLNYLLLIVIAIILIATLVTSFGYRANNFWPWGRPAKQYSIVEVSGRLIDPLTQSGAANVDLVSGNTSIRTSAGGQFLFSNVTAEGIRATHVNLLRAFVFLPDASQAKQQANIYFDVNLYNTLVKIIDLEARGKNFEVYSLLSPQIKEKITADKYQAAAKSIFAPVNINDQQVNLLESALLDNYEAKNYNLKFNKVLRLRVAANEKTDDYYFGSDGQGGWQLIK